MFQQIGGNSGVAFILPLTMFLFVVALGTDDNILMTARLREEMLAGKPVREAVRSGRSCSIPTGARAIRASGAPQPAR